MCLQILRILKFLNSAWNLSDKVSLISSKIQECTHSVFPHDLLRGNDRNDAGRCPRPSLPVTWASWGKPWTFWLRIAAWQMLPWFPPPSQLRDGDIWGWASGMGSNKEWEMMILDDFLTPTYITMDNHIQSSFFIRKSSTEGYHSWLQPPGELGVVDLDSKIVGRVAAKRISHMSKKSLLHLRSKLGAQAHSGPQRRWFFLTVCCWKWLFIVDLLIYLLKLMIFDRYVRLPEGRRVAYSLFCVRWDMSGTFSYLFPIEINLPPWTRTGRTSRASRDVDADNHNVAANQAHGLESECASDFESVPDEA